MGRAPCCEKNGLKKGPWTPEEDQKLIDYIQKHGYGNWRTLPKNAGLQRCGKSCRLRWTNYLRPDIKRGRFSFEEEETIIQLHSILGNKWSAIAARIPGRTDNEIKNYWNTHVRKKLLRMGIDPVTHSPRLDLLDLSSLLPSNMSRLLGYQPLVNPELLKLATTLLSSQYQADSQENSFQIQNNFKIPNTQIQNPSTMTTTTTNNNIPCVPCFNEAELMNNSNFDQYSINNIPSFDAQNFDQWQSTCLPSSEDLVNSFNYYEYDSNSAIVDQSNYTNGQQSFVGFGPSSVMSTPSSNSNSNSNSNSTYFNGGGTEDERESYCSDMMIKFEVPDFLDVNEFILAQTNCL